jgi:UDP-galactopyranose mutase
MKDKHQILVVGAGFSGAVVARILADVGHQIHLVEKRSHLGGNAFDRLDENDVLIHEYGPHIFHTNSKKVVEFLSRFTDWRFYEHRVLGRVDEKLVPIPINRTTINKLYNLNLTESEVEGFLESRREKKDEIRSSADVVLNSVGKELCDKFFRGYTLKQWGIPLEELSSGVASRIPTRTNDDDRYFTDTYQLMPLEGYTRMFERILNHSNIHIELNHKFDREDASSKYRHIIYTGPIDAYFNHCLGELPYRSLRFEHKYHQDVNEFQGVGTVNYPQNQEFTRITEFKHLTGQRCKGTSIVYEFPTNEGDPYYPIPRQANQDLFEKYEKLAGELPNTTFIGRLAQYKYYNMDQVVAAAMHESKKILEKIDK